MTTKTSPTAPSPSGRAADAADALAHKADDAIRASKRVVANSADALQDELDELSNRAPAALSRLASQAEDLTRRGIERARETAAVARERATEVGDVTVDRIKADPVKAVMIAAAAGAATALLVQWLSRSRRNA